VAQLERDLEAIAAKRALPDRQLKEEEDRPIGNEHDA